MKQLTELQSWHVLRNHADSIRLHTFDERCHLNMQSQTFKLQVKGLSLNFSHQHMNETTIELLVTLAQERQLQDRIDALIRGEEVNQSENRAALHTALRVMDNDPIYVNGENVVPAVLETREKMRFIADTIRSGQWYGYSGKPIKDIVNIGIGGSDFGPRLCVDALAEFVNPSLGYHFISDADPNAFAHAVKMLEPETTLFIVSTKSFTTSETLYNLKKAYAWFGNKAPKGQHFIAVTANINLAKAWGIETILPIWDWVGGRYSFCSAINLIGCIAIGYDHFMDLLAGAHCMDGHFQQTSFEKNMPVMLGLIGLWNINFLHISNLLLLYYARQLKKFVPYLQQLDMESNGKSIDNKGRAVNHATSPIVWGGSGNQAQHSYYQLLCQGSHKTTIDFLSISQFDDKMINTMCDVKMRVLSEGVNAIDSKGNIPGKTPMNRVHIESCTPFNLGLLTALYEHKIYVQSVLWNINAFDQPGIESAKKLLSGALSAKESIIA